MGVRAKLVQLFDRSIEVIKQDNIYANGSDNDYPERVKRVINNSITAKSSAEQLSSYLIGEGFNLGNETVVNRFKDLDRYDVLKSACENASIQKGFYIHVNYTIEGVVDYVDIIPYEKIRSLKKDDLGFDGGYVYKENWAKEKSFSFKKSESKYFYTYNRNIDVINKQRIKDAGNNADIQSLKSKYRGQLLFVNLEPNTIYPLSFIDPCYNDADTEFRISLLRNKKTRTGFVEANVFIVRDEETLTVDQIKGLYGSENQGNALYVVADTLDPGQKLEDAIHVQTIKSDINKDLFADWVKDIKNNIRNSFCRIPQILVESGDGALFGANADAMGKAHNSYNNSTAKYRKIIEKAFREVFQDKELKIVKLNLNEGDINQRR